MWLATAAGFDPLIMKRLGLLERAWLAVVGALNLSAALIAGLSGGYVCDLVFGYDLVAGVGGLGIALFWFNILRLTIATGALAPHLPHDELSRWRPPHAPLLFLALFGVFFAQPVLMLAARPSLDATARETARIERSLLEEGRSVGSSAGAPPAPVADGQLVDRVRALWRHPLLASFGTILVAAILGGGALLRILGVGHTRAYEAVRHADERAQILAAYAEHRRVLDGTFALLLGRAPPADTLYEDPPFNQRPRRMGPPGKRVKLGTNELQDSLRGGGIP